MARRDDDDVSRRYFEEEQRSQGPRGPARLARDFGDRTLAEGASAVERSIAYAYLPAEHASVDQPVEVEIFGEWIPGRVAAEPLFDPEGSRIRA